MTLAMLVALFGCGASKPLVHLSDDAARLSAQAIREADVLPNGALRPRRLPSLEVPKPVADDVESAVRARTISVLDGSLSQIGDLDEARSVLRAACYAKDIMEVGQSQSWEEATAAAIAHFGGDGTRHARVRALAQDLSTATTADIVGALAVFSVCEAA